MGKIRMGVLSVGAAIALLPSVAMAAVTFDPATGTGFVGKGDVQTALILNNNQLQAQAGSFSFTVSSTEVTTWTCTRVVELGNGGTNEIVQQRSVTTTKQGLLSSVERVKNQITGFNLNGSSGPPTITTDGPAIGSCPATPSGFVYDDNAETVSGGSVLSVNGVALS